MKNISKKFKKDILFNFYIILKIIRKYIANLKNTYKIFKCMY